MGANTKIEWADHTFNPWLGCTKVSAACDHCYAERWAKRAGRGELWKGARAKTSAANWRQPLLWNAAAARAGKRMRVFCASLADVFDNQAEPVWRAELWRLIECTPQLDWLLLTKRPQNIAGMLPPHWNLGFPNVWLGTTVETQTEANRRVPFLLQTPAARRFVSCEPLLSPVDLRDINIEGLSLDALSGWRRIDWVIAGGESGGEARPTHPDWLRGLRAQCAARKTAFFFKQWGEWFPGELEDDGDSVVAAPDIEHDAASVDWQVSTARHRVLNGMGMLRVGKRLAGRKLDNRTHDEVPS